MNILADVFGALCLVLSVFAAFLAWRGVVVAGDFRPEVKKRLTHMRFILRMVVVDKKITPEEYAFVKTTAKRLHLSNRQLRSLTVDVLNQPYRPFLDLLPDSDMLRRRILLDVIEVIDRNPVIENCHIELAEVISLELKYDKEAAHDILLAFHDIKSGRVKVDDILLSHVPEI